MSEFYLPNDYMLSLLKAIHLLQLDLVREGHAVRVDASVHENHGEDGTHISISLYIDGRYYDFSGVHPREKLDARLISISNQYD